MNRYTYAWGNPMKFLDSNGRDVTYFLSVSGGSSASGYVVDPGHAQALVTTSTGRSIGLSVFKGSSNGETHTDPQGAEEIVQERPEASEVVSFTVETTDQGADALIDFVQALSAADPGYSIMTMLPYNCAASCAMLAEAMGVDISRVGTPANVFWRLYRAFNASSYKIKRMSSISWDTYGRQRAIVKTTWCLGHNNPPGCP